ncbi:MAG: hypothetical protein ACRBFS_17555 [Aureispira sp.]
MKSTTTLLFCCLFISLFQACNDPNYNGEQYQAFESMDELTLQIVESIQTEKSDQLLRILDNQVLLRDLLLASEGESAQQIQNYMNSDQGKRALSVEQMAQKQRIAAFFSTSLPQQLGDKASTLRNTGVEIVHKQAYEEGSPAEMQSYSLRLTDEASKSYTYDFKVIYWNGYYHLVEVAGFLNPV